MLENFKISLFCQNRLQLQPTFCWATMTLRLAQLVKAWCKKKKPVHQGCGINPCMDCSLTSWILVDLFQLRRLWLWDLYTRQDRKLWETWLVYPWKGKGRWIPFKYCLSPYFVLKKAYKFWFFFCYFFNLLIYLDVLLIKPYMMKSLSIFPHL